MWTIGQTVVVAILVSLLWGIATLALDPERLDRAFALENERSVRWFGEERAENMRGRAKLWVDGLFPQVSEAPAQEDRGPAMVIKAQIEDVRRIAEQAVFRAQTVFWVLLLAAPFIVAAAVDGVVVRMKKNEQMHSENPRIYHLAKHALIGITIAPILIATIPVGLGPPVAVFWVGLVTVTIWGMAQNVEREI